GLEAQKRTARDFAGNPQRFRDHSLKLVKRALNIDIRRWNEAGRQVFENFAVFLAMIPDFTRWDASQRGLTARIITAKAARDEALYLRLMGKQARMRAAMIRLGSRV